MWQLAFVAALSGLVAASGGNRQVQREETPRNVTQVVRSNFTCPEKAVCADVFDYNQTDEATGESIPRRRRVVNCQCEGRDPSHKDAGCPNVTRSTLFASPRHRLQICTSRARLGRCKRSEIAAQMHVNHNGHTYFTMNCWCRRHRRPQPSGGFRERATQLLNHDFEDDHMVHNYVCVRDRRRGRNTRS